MGVIPHVPAQYQIENKAEQEFNARDNCSAYETAFQKGKGSVFVKHMVQH